jgi:acetyl-CoA synthetase
MGASRRDLKSILLEERVFPAPRDFAAKARVKPRDLEQMRRRAAADPQGFWADLARRELHWHSPFTVTLDDSRAPHFEWFKDGRLNVSVNCLDVHLAERGHETAVIFEGEPGDVRHLSFQELHAEVCRFANALRAQGVRPGDRVVIYMPLVPEAIIAMQACARIGAVHSVVFGGFSARSLQERIVDAGARILVTADGGWRAGHVVELKVAADKAIESGCPTVEKVVVYRRTGTAVSMHPTRDVWWHDFVEGQAPVCEPEWVGAEHPLFLLYTSGSTGTPKGIQHSSAGYLLGAKTSCQWVLDVRARDIFWCTADVGWVTGHTYVAYGPLSLGAAVVLYEGAPTWPDGARFWKICETHGVTIFYTAPTAIRALMKLGEDLPGRHDLSRLRLLGSVGEPINPEAWMWYHRVIGGGRCPIVDTWWQTETGAIMIAPIPGVTRAKPGSCTTPLPGIDADIVDERGQSVTRADQGGYLVIRKPWPHMLRTIWGDDERYRQTYWARFENRFYVAGDGAHRDADGDFWIMGRIDDVLNVAGHRLGTMEIESALVAHPRVAEAAVVGKPHEIKGEAVLSFVILRGARPSGEMAARLVQELRVWVGEQLGAIAKPDEIRLVETLPKTRSGKIMRRLLRAIARGEEVSQDISTLENPAILAELSRAVATDAAGLRRRVRPDRPRTAKASSPTGKARKSKSSRPARKAGKAKSARASGKVRKAKAPRTAAKRGKPRVVRRRPAAGASASARRASAPRRIGSRSGKARRSRGSEARRPRR